MAYIFPLYPQKLSSNLAMELGAVQFRIWNTLLKVENTLIVDVVVVIVGLEPLLFNNFTILYQLVATVS